jgi:hypothetical protein
VVTRNDGRLAVGRIGSLCEQVSSLPLLIACKCLGLERNAYAFVVPSLL